MSIVLTSRSGPDSKLRLEIPVSRPGEEFEVIVTAIADKPPSKLPPGYFDLIGSITDETFVRPQTPLRSNAES